MSTSEMAPGPQPDSASTRAIRIPRHTGGGSDWFASIDVISEIAAEDVMHEGDERHYFNVGISALESIMVALEAARRQEPANILDLPSGHGRVMRGIPGLRFDGV
jgi:hypothetical protein